MSKYLEIEKALQIYKVKLNKNINEFRDHVITDNDVEFLKSELGLLG